MSKNRARTPVGRAYEWWAGVKRPSLADSEEYVADVPAHMLDLPWWKLIGGRLLLTNRRLIYLPGVPRILPRRVFAPPTIDVDFRAISDAEASRRLLRAILTSAPGPEVLTIQTKDGRRLRFQVYDARSLRDKIVGGAGHGDMNTLLL